MAIARENHPEIIICDIGLPGMDGYAVVRQLRMQCFEPVPVCVAMTGYDQPGYRNRGTDAGFDRYLVKPVSIEALMRLISDLNPHQVTPVSQF